jgi:hypothetical protein
MELSKRYWLGAPVVEAIFILAPPLVSVALVILFNSYFSSNGVSTVWWIILVLCIDVSHVYSTLFRMYWDKKTFTKYKKHLVIIPIVGLASGILVHLYSPLLFWRVLAYLAVFHFIRQQYGFMRLYARNQDQGRSDRLIDQIAIYAATIYPLLYWHSNPTKNMNWFVDGDFVAFSNPYLIKAGAFLYYIIIILYVGKEFWLSRKTDFNIPKNLVMVGTFLSWYVGIVAFQADLIFTLLNVVSHGIPYMALIWIYGDKKIRPKFSFNYKGVAIFVSVLLLLAYLEEYFWDVLIWNDHPNVFPSLSMIEPLQHPFVIAILVPLLVLPQVTHYVLDGFIWKQPKRS